MHLQEEKLVLKKAVIDLQINNNNIVEETDSKSYEMVNKLLKCENENVQLRLELENLTKSHTELKTSMAKLKTQHGKLQTDLKDLGGARETSEASQKRLSQKAEELSLEVINLMNAKAALVKENEAKAAEITKLLKHNEFLKAKLANHEFQEFESSTAWEMFKQKSEYERNQILDSKQGLEWKINAVEQEKSRLENELDQLRNSHAVALDAMKTKYENELDRKVEEVNRITSTLEDLKEKYMIITTELEIYQKTSLDHRESERKLKEVVEDLQKKVIVLGVESLMMSSRMVEN
ncbi:hypothetical protein HK102_007958 [Quaeritorhiza haematococci]|nr:hypothetical protein HK102_007958 [Quaeritorhiza haematococci]